MKDVFKGAAIKVISLVVIVGIICGGGYLAYRHFVGGITENFEHEIVNDIEVIKEKLETTAELNTGSYLCTDVITRTDSRKFKNWEIPFTEKSFIVQYDGVVKVGIKDLTKADVTQRGEKIIITLPRVEITGIEIDNDSFKKLDESNNIFNPITVEDLNNAQKDLKEKMQERAMEKDILGIAKDNAETVIAGMMGSANGEYQIQIEWKQ